MSRQTLFKSNWVVFEDTQTKIIDSNEQAANAIEKMRIVAAQSETEAFPEGFTEGLNPEKVERLLAEEQAETAEPVIQIDTEAILMGAQTEAERIIEEAKKIADALKERAEMEGRELGKQAGYEDGRHQATLEYDQKIKQLNDREEALAREYEERFDTLEPLLVETITDIYEHIIGVKLKEEKKILLHLIQSTLKRADGAKDFILHVSRRDYPEVVQAKQILLDACISKDTTVEVIEDLTLSENECLIETDSGIYDCSLGVELGEVANDLKMLSYERT